jgi:FkbM family methyltransferase
MIQQLIRLQQFLAQDPLASRNISGAWKRWLRWQVGSRLLGAPVIMPWLEGSSLVVETGMTGATGNLYCGLHEFNDMALVLHFFGGGPGMFLDVGANIGSYSVLAAKVCGASVIALEPVPETFNKLTRNLLINGIQDRVEAHRAAVGDVPGSLNFSADRDTMNQVVGDGYHGASIQVQVVTLDNLLEGRTAQVWKVDVEGFERQVLAGASKALSDTGLALVLLEGEDAEIKNTMRSHGFEELRYDAFSRRFSAAAGELAIGNHVWVRDREQVERRCQAARQFKLHDVEF